VLIRDIECGLHDEEFAELPTHLQMRVLKHRELCAERPHFQAKFLARAQRQLEPAVDQPKAPATESTVDQPSTSSSTTTPKASPAHKAQRQQENLRTLLRDIDAPLSEEEINKLPPGLQKRLRKLREKRATHPKFADKFVARTTAQLDTLSGSDQTPQAVTICQRCGCSSSSSFV